MHINELYQDAKKLIDSSNLSEKDKTLWISQLKNTPQEYIRLFFETFSTNLSYLPIATDMLKLQIKTKNTPTAVENLLSIQIEEIKKAFKQSVPAHG